MGQEELDWRVRGFCHKLTSRQFDEYFFPNSGKVSTKTREFCSNCPVIGECLKFALETNAQGIWAGTTEKERGKMQRFVKPQPQPKLKTVSFSFS